LKQNHSNREEETCEKSIQHLYNQFRISSKGGTKHSSLPINMNHFILA